MRNPLAEPYLLGVSGGAAVGAVLAVAGGAPFGLVPVGAFAGAVAAVMLVLAIARAGGRRPDPRVLLMAGVVVGAFANAVIMIALASAPADSVRNALWWMMGSVAGATWVQIGWFAAYGIVSAGALLLFAPEIDVLALGDDAAAGLGVNVDRAGRRAYVIASLLAAATVAAAGFVGFVGLVVPHLVRTRAGSRHRAVIAAAGLAGATLVILADLVARTLRAPSEIAARRRHGAGRCAVLSLPAAALPMIRFDDVVVRYPRAAAPAVDGVSFDVPDGQDHGDRRA